MHSATCATTRPRHARFARLQIAQHARLRTLPRGRQCHAKGGCQRKGDAIEGKPAIPHEVEHHSVPAIARHHGGEPARRPTRHQRTGQHARYAEHQTFGQKLPDHPGAAGAQRKPDRDLPPPRRHPREQQVRDVGAHDQDGDHRKPRQHGQEDGDRIPPQILMQRVVARRAQTHVLEVAGMLDAQGNRQRGQFAIGALRRDARLQTPQYAEPRGIARARMIEGAVQGVQARQRRPHIGIAHESAAAKALLRHADDGMHHAVERERGADRAGGAIPAALPEPMADHSRRGLLRRDPAAGRHAQVQGLKEIVGNGFAGHAIGLPTSRHRVAPQVVSGHVLKRSGGGTKVLEVGVRQVLETAGAERAADQHKPVLIADLRHGAQQHRVGQHQHGQIDSDAEGQHQ